MFDNKDLLAIQEIIDKKTKRIDSRLTRIEDDISFLRKYTIDLIKAFRLIKADTMMLKIESSLDSMHIKEIKDIVKRLENK